MKKNNNNENKNNVEDDGGFEREIDQEFLKLEKYHKSPYRKVGDDVDKFEQEQPYTIITGRHIGLKLTITQSFLDSCQKILDEAPSTKLSNSSWKQNDDEGCSSSYDHGRLDTNTDDLGSVTPAQKEKMKASNFPVNLLRIGPDCQFCADNEGELMAKVYYAKKKIVWEILDVSLKLKMKMEIKWSDINSIRLNLSNQHVGYLEIELNKPPSFHHEIDPQPRKHTIWKDYIDFTGGHASDYRIHYLEFSPRVLDRHYEKLFGSNGQLTYLLIDDFPRHTSLHFHNYAAPHYNGSGLSCSFPLPISNLSLTQGEEGSQHRLIETQNHNINNYGDHEENYNIQGNPHHELYENIYYSSSKHFEDFTEAHYLSGNDKIALSPLTLPAQSGQHLNNTINYHAELDNYVDWSEPTMLTHQDQYADSSFKSEDGNETNAYKRFGDASFTFHGHHNTSQPSPFSKPPPHLKD